MRKYPQYKATNIDWIGELPEKWQVTSFKRLSQIKRGASPRPIDDQKYFDEEGEFGWVRIADVTASERYLLNTTQKLSNLGASLSVKQYPGDFFLSIAGTVGKPIITKIKCCIHDGFVWFPNLEINPEFLYYIFSAGLAYQGLGKLGTQLNLNTDTVGYISLPIPSTEEINVIVKFLDRETEKIDSLISKKQKLIDLLKEERTAIINQAVTRGINPDVKMKDSGIEWLGKIPKNWEIKKLKYIINGRLKYGANEVAELDDTNLPRYIRITDFGDDGNLKKDTFKSLPVEKAKEYLLENGDILFARSGATVGKTFQFKHYKGTACFAGYLIKATPLSEVISSDFLYFITKSNYYDNWKKSIFIQATIQNIGADKYNLFLIASPPLMEQRTIVSHIEKENLKIDTTVLKIQKEIDLLQEYRTALISEVVTGKIDVRDQVVV